MRSFLCIVLSVFFVLILEVLASAQCQLVTDDPPEQDTSPTDQIDTSIVDNIDAYVEELPDIPPAYLPLMFERALEAARSGDYELAAKIYQYMIRLEPKPVMLYNLACIYSLMNKPEWATSYIEKAAQYGWTNWDSVDNDTDFDNVRSNEGFVTKLTELKSRQQEIEAGRGSLNYSSAQITVPYRLHLPDGFEPEKTYNLVVALHGAGDKADNFTRLWSYFENPDFILAVPQAPYLTEGAWGQSGNQWFSYLGDRSRETIENQAASNEQYILNLIEKLKTQHNVRNVYLLGFSQGAALAYVCALHNPDKIDGIVVFGGALLQIHNEPYFTDSDIARGKSVRVFIAHGLDDNFADGAQATYDRLIAAQYNVKLYPYEGGHYINLSALLEAQKWMNLN